MVDIKLVTLNLSFGRREPLGARGSHILFIPDEWGVSWSYFFEFPSDMVGFSRKSNFPVWQFTHDWDD